MNPQIEAQETRAKNLIESSARHGDIQTAEANEATSRYLLAFLSAASDDGSEQATTYRGEDVIAYEYWGADEDGAKWSVNVMVSA